eukprot:1232046-Rhodomonas_salina.1
MHTECTRAGCTPSTHTYRQTHINTHTHTHAHRSRPLSLACSLSLALQRAHAPSRSPSSPCPTLSQRTPSMRLPLPLFPARSPPPSRLLPSPPPRLPPPSAPALFQLPTLARIVMLCRSGLRLQLAGVEYAANSNTRNRIPSANGTESAVPCVGFRGVELWSLRSV